MKDMKTLGKVNLADDEVILSLVEEYKGRTTFDKTFAGKNENGEMVIFHIEDEGVLVETYQENGWVRMNHYLIDEDFGIIREEYFNGRWK